MSTSVVQRRVDVAVIRDAIASATLPGHTVPAPRAVPSPQAKPARRLERVLNLCALCMRPGGKTMFTAVGSLIVRCERCGLVREASRPAATSKVYDADYYCSTDSSKDGYANYVLDAEINRLTFAERLRAIEAKLGRRGRLLDVGCALGDFVDVARESGWGAEGVEISAFAAAEGRRRGLRIYTGVLEDLRLPGGRYDAITLYDVIEHLTDPVRTLHEVWRLLRPGGIVHIVTPNVGGIQARALGPAWYHYKPDEHLFYFSPDTIRIALKRAWFEWRGWSRAGSFVTFTYVLRRLRYHLPGPLGLLERLGRAVAFGPAPFKLFVGEMEVWAERPVASDP